MVLGLQRSFAIYLGWADFLFVNMFWSVLSRVPDTLQLVGKGSVVRDYGVFCPTQSVTCIKS